MKKLKRAPIYFFAIVMLMIMAFPIYVMFISSFKDITAVFDMVLFPRLSTLSFDNYIEVFEKANLGLYIKNSFFVASIVTVIALLFHSMSAYALARLNFPGKKLIFTWIISTLMIPFSVIMIPLFIIVKNLGLVNNLWGVIIPMIPNAYGIFLYRQFFLGIPSELEESAKIDGASIIATFWRIVMPLAGPITVTLGISFFLANWNNYLWPLIIAQDRNIWLLQIAIASFKTEHSTAWNLTMAASCIAALPTIVLFFIFQRYIADGIKTTGIKG